MKEIQSSDKGYTAKPLTTSSTFSAYYKMNETESLDKGYNVKTLTTFPIF